MKTVLLFVFLGSCTTFAKVEGEMEAAVKLSPQGVRKVIAHFKGVGFKDRHDITFEAYADGRYILRNLNPKVRVRVKYREKFGEYKKSRLQMIQRIKTSISKCGNNSVKVTEKVGEVIKIKGKDIEAVKNRAEAVFASLEEGHSDSPALIRKFHLIAEKLLSKLETDTVSSALAGEYYTLVPAVVFSRDRQWKIEEVVDGKEVQYKIVETHDIDQSGNGQVRHKLEVESEEPSQWQAQQMSDLLCQKFDLQNLSSADFSSLGDGGKEYMLELLSKNGIN